MNQRVQQSKVINKKRVLHCIQQESPISRADIAAKIHLSKPTVSLLVDELLQENKVYEKGIGPSSSQGGRKPIHLYFNERAAYVIGTDIGGTKVKTILSDLNGTILHTKSFSTASHLRTGLFEQLSRDVSSMLSAEGINVTNVLGMGIGVPGITKNGVVIDAPSLDWVRYPIQSEAERHFPFPVYVENDVNVAVLGEQWIGNARNKRHVLFIAVGTGIGSGIIIHDRLYRGGAHASGEMGYMVTDRRDFEGDFQPIFHRYGYLESVAGGKAIGATFTRSVVLDPVHPAYQAAMTGELSGELAFRYASEGDAVAMSIVNDAITQLGYGIINAASVLNPEVIILGGGVLKSADYILPKLERMVNEYLPIPIELKVSELGSNAGVIGAVSLFLREHEGTGHLL
ncbi:ROK family transcriptional regulator [Rossellomorea marisflavi]|uniref:ROK family transcriptional regulator n=1 Tax=Rossellomorea marisflavi TaxID=189381 RepID=UPI0034592112